MARDTERVNFILPKELVAELRELVPARQRSELVARALAEKLARLRQVRAVREGAGAWSDEDHPELRRYEDYEHWIETLRGSAEDRRRHLGLEAESEDVPSG